MMNKALFALWIAVWVFVAPALAQEDTQFSIVNDENGQETAPQSNNFESILDSLQGEDAQPQMSETMQDEMETQLIDPDFLREDEKVYDDYAKVKLRFLNKITAESETHDLEIDKTVAYGSLRIRPKACKKAPPIEEPESASFLQVWEKVISGEDQWVFSGWMFASSPSLSPMEHPVYDIWVIDCLD